MNVIFKGSLGGIIVGVAYLTLNLLPPTPSHLIGLVPTVTTLTGYHATRHKAKVR
jgi:XapX domain-containing protein